MSDSSYPLIIAHRGSSINAYENSLAAFELAIKQKADMIELDTHLTQDGFFVVYHDGVIKLQGENFVISKTKLENIKQLSLPNGEPVPILEDVLKRFLPSIQFNVEIKCKVKREQFEDLLNEVGGDNSKIIVSSFRFSVMDELKNSKLGYDLAFLYFFLTPKIKQKVALNYITAFNPNHTFLREKHVNFYHENKKKVYPWTIDAEKDIKKLVKKRVDGIITNDPENTRKIVESQLKIQD